MSGILAYITNEIKKKNGTATTAASSPVAQTVSSVKDALNPIPNTVQSGKYAGGTAKSPIANTVESVWQTQQQAAASKDTKPATPTTPTNNANPATGSANTPLVQYSNEYLEKAGQLMTQLETMMKTPFTFDVTKDPSYLAAQQLAQKQAKVATQNSLETMNDRGIINSSVTAAQLGQIEADAAEKPLELLPQLQQAAYGQYQDGISNTASLMNTYLNTGQAQLDFAQNKSYQDAMISGDWVDPNLALILNLLKGAAGGTVPGDKGTDTLPGATNNGTGGTGGTTGTDGKTSTTDKKPVTMNYSKSITEGGVVYTTDSAGNIYKNGNWVDPTNYAYLPKAIVTQAQDVKTANSKSGTTTSGGTTDKKTGAAATAANTVKTNTSSSSSSSSGTTKPTSTNPNAIVLGGQSYSVSSTGEIFKNGIHVPAENIKYIPAEVQQKAAAAKK